MKVVEERGSEVFHHFDPRFPQPITHKHTHIFRLLRIHLLGLLQKQAWLQETVPTASRTLLQKREEKLQNITTNVGEETYLKYFDFGDMDSSLAYIKILDYWYWKVVDYRIQVTFGNIENFLYYLTIHVQLNVLFPEIASSSSGRFNVSAQCQDNKS